MVNLIHTYNVQPPWGIEGLLQPRLKGSSTIGVPPNPLDDGCSRMFAHP